MNLPRVLHLGLFCLLFNASLSASNYNGCVPCLTPCSPICSEENNTQHFGTATLSTGPDQWYTIETNSYPQTTPLSQGRNKGLSEGGVFLSPTGFTIGEAGNYWVSVTVVFQNPTSDSTILIPFFLAVDETFDPDDASPIGGVVTLESGKIITGQSSGILKDVTPGSRISLVATNAGYPFPTPVTVVSWSISLFKMP